MKVTNNRCSKGMVGVSTVSPGTPVQFDRVFNSNYPPQELFVVMEISSSYRSVHDNHIGKVPVMSVTCGRLSFVDGHRSVVKMDAEVNVNGPQT